MNVLICSQYGEPQVDEVCIRLQKMGVNPIIFERYRKDQFITYHYNKKISAVLRTTKEEFPLTKETFPAVWYRPKPIILSEIPGENAKIQEKFCIQEWRAILQSLDIFLSDSKWINPLSANKRAANKAYQLKLASDSGLTIPQTMITNDAVKTLNLFQNNRVIYKTLNAFFSAKQAIYTNEILYDQVIKNQQAIAMAPGIFQKYINKKYELRITVIGEKLFIVKINSQLLSESSVDWRRRPDRELYDVGEISSETRRKLLNLHKGLGLIYAAYDFVVDEDGHEIFIECNPSGQWLWLEKSVDMNISQAMADELSI